VQSHILSIRESELKARLAAAESRATTLEIEVEALTTLLRKEQASRLAAERRAATAPTPPSAPRGKARKPGRKSPRTAVASRRPVTTRRKPR
jgi:hypothetical protein